MIDVVVKQKIPSPGSWIRQFILHSHICNVIGWVTLSSIEHAYISKEIFVVVKDGQENRLADSKIYKRELAAWECRLAA